MADLPWDDIEAWLEVRDATQIADDIRAYAAAKVAEERAKFPNLTPVIQWLENGCDPLEAAMELRIYQHAIRGTEA